MLTQQRVKDQPTSTKQSYANSTPSNGKSFRRTNSCGAISNSALSPATHWHIGWGMFGRAPVYVMSYEYTGGSCKGLPIDARKAGTQARVQVEERGFVLHFMPKWRVRSQGIRFPSHLRLVRRQLERRITRRCLSEKRRGRCEALTQSVNFPCVLFSSSKVLTLYDSSQIWIKTHAWVRMWVPNPHPFNGHNPGKSAQIAVGWYL